MLFRKVDKHIRRLDSDLSRFEQELQLKDPSGRRTSTASLSDLQSLPYMSEFMYMYMLCMYITTVYMYAKQCACTCVQMHVHMYILIAPNEIKVCCSFH